MNRNNIDMGCSSIKTFDQKTDLSKTIECPVKKFLNSDKEYYVEQINTGCLSQFCYYIECNGEAAIVDPLRDIEVYITLLEKRCAKLIYIFETHFHADFVSGHVDLSKKTGAKIIFGPTAVAEYQISVAKDEQLFKLGDVQIQVLHTPGHTMESSCFLILDKSNTPRVIFTGDTIFLGEVGRPDLAVKGDVTEKALAAFLYESIQKIKKIPDDVLIFPGHGAGSACGKKISSGEGDTIKGQKEKNYALSDIISKEEFIEVATNNLPIPPSYFFYDAVLNKKGYTNIDEVLSKSLKGLSPTELESNMNSDDFESGQIVILDTRDYQVANKGYIRGSIIIPLKITYAIWTATLFNHNTRFILVTDQGKEKESIIRLTRVGYDQTIGYLEGGVQEYAKFKKENIVSVLMPSKDEIKNFISSGHFQLIDVREKGEVETSGMIETSISYPLSQFFNYIEQLRKCDKPLGIYCKTGGRASISGSILIKNNFNSNNIYILGGFEDLINLGFKSIK